MEAEGTGGNRGGRNMRRRSPSLPLFLGLGLTSLRSETGPAGAKYTVKETVICSAHVTRHSPRGAHSILVSLASQTRSSSAVWENYGDRLLTSWTGPAERTEREIKGSPRKELWWLETRGRKVQRGNSQVATLPWLIPSSLPVSVLLTVVPPSAMMITFLAYPLHVLLTHHVPRGAAEEVEDRRGRTCNG